jgi:hypothetical protein
MSNLQFDFGNQRPSGKSGELFATIFLILFATPFAGFGLVAAVAGVRKFIAGDTTNGLMLCLFGLIFSGVGFGLMFLAIRGRKKLKEQAELQVRYPDKPWMLRADWAAGRIKSSNSAQFKILAFMAVMFCGMGALFTAVMLPEELHKEHYLALLILLFPAIGIGFLIAAVRALIAHRRFGDCFFEMAAIPAAPGGALEGMIQTGARLQLEHGLHLKLSCIRRVTTGAGKSRSTHESVLWQDEKVFNPHANLPEPEPGRTGIPIFFKLPADQPESTGGSGDGIYWRLEAKAKMAGPDFSVRFDVPVFKVAGAANAVADEPDPTAALQESVEELRRDENSKIQVTDGPNGREFYFPAARNLGTALLLTVVLAVWSGFLWLMISKQAPILFPIVFGLFEIFILWGCFTAWFKSSRITIDSSGVTAVNRWLIFSRTRRFAADEVARFATKAGMQSGSRVYLDIKLIPPGSDEKFAANTEKFRKAFQDASIPEASKVAAQLRGAAGPAGVTVASSIASSAEANWLVQEMNKALGHRV